MKKLFTLFALVAFLGVFGVKAYDYKVTINDAAGATVTWVDKSNTGSQAQTINFTQGAATITTESAAIGVTVTPTDGWSVDTITIGSTVAVPGESRDLTDEGNGAWSFTANPGSLNISIIVKNENPAPVGVPVTFNVADEAIDSVAFRGETKAFADVETGYALNFGGLKETLPLYIYFNEAKFEAIDTLEATYSYADTTFAAIVNKSTTEALATVQVPDSATALTIKVTVNEALVKDSLITYYVVSDYYPAVVLQQLPEGEVIALDKDTVPVSLMVSEAAPYDSIAIKAAEGYMIVSVKDAKGDIADYSAFRVYNGDTIFVETATAEFGTQFAVYVQGDSVFSAAAYASAATGTQTLRMGGYTTVTFNEGEQFSISAAAADTTAFVYAYADNEAIDSVAPKGGWSYSFEPEADQVIKIFVGEPKSYNVEFEVTDSALSAEVTYDILRSYDLEANEGLKEFEGTLITIVAPAGVYVSANGVDLAPVATEDEDGEEDEEDAPAVETKAAAAVTYEYVLTEDVTIKLSTEASAIVSVEAADNAEEAIFNLQGIKVNRNNLPAGIYIVNGKKQVIR